MKQLNDTVALLEKIGDYIIKCQTPEGGICNRPLNDKKTVGYSYGYLLMVYNFAPIGLLKIYEMTNNKKYLQATKKWIQFWADRQNFYDDRFGLTGTFYDYLYDPNLKSYKRRIFGEENAANNGGAGYDSTDAYPAMFLYVINHYLNLTQELKFISQLKKNIIAAGESMIATLYKDELTWCHPNYPYVFLMDVSETYAGLLSHIKLLEFLGEKELKEKFRKIAEKSKAAILRLWNSQKGEFYWAINRVAGRHYLDYAYLLRPTDWRNWFPDVCENHWPVLWDVIDGKSKISKEVWKKTKQYHKNFTKDFSHYSCLPQIGIVAVKSGELKIAQEIYETLKKSFEILNDVQGFGISHELGMFPLLIQLYEQEK